MEKNLSRPVSHTCVVRLIEWLGKGAHVSLCLGALQAVISYDEDLDVHIVHPYRICNIRRVLLNLDLR